MAYENIIVSTEGTVGLIQFNRPKTLNALNTAMIIEMNAALDSFEKPVIKAAKKAVYAAPE
jgi:enoyl-CoA hydratase